MTGKSLPAQTRFLPIGAMSDGFAYLDILIFAMVAAFVAYRLRSVLGRRTGHERRRPDAVPRTHPAPREQAPAQDNVVPLPERGAAQVPTSDDPAIADVTDAGLKSGLTEIRMADPSFDLDGFLRGARAAFTMVVEAFAKGDRATLRPLLADPVFGEFARAIDDREGRGHTLSTELVALRAAELIGAEMRGGKARMAVRFTSEQINVTHDVEGNVVEGDAKRIADVVDQWTFERDSRSRDPNWALVETGPAT